ncbi:nitrate/nitrite transporter NrtS [uncultured Psychromonas sp.]|uniref:nitrate/nitrite transporter NrtS n=1 Tax=uncultured Psychromonas sp. TaxID=173974 RepID=UPI0026235C80|nr:nitrate/nitrite transporter NrtS [uncultured Psychromonas sp.]
MTKQAPGFLDIALTSKVVKPALKVALFVGTLLALINHGSALLLMDLDMSRFFQIILTYFVPYGVSTYSAVKAIQNIEKVK